MIEMPGFTFTLPEDLVAEGINAAGWARVDYNKGWARIWLYDPSTDLIAQLPHPGFFEITFMSNDMTLDEYAAESVNSSDGTYNADLFKDVMVDLGSNNTFHYYVMDYGKLEELAPGSMQGTEDGYLQRGIDQARIDKAKELNARLEELTSCFQPTDLTVPKVQTAADIDTSKLSNLTLQDLDGNQVKLGDIFAKNKVTMVDMWNTICTVCVEDMPTLEKYSKDYANQGFGIVGVCCDVVDNNGEIDDDLLYDAQDIRKRTGITYPTVLADGTYRQLVEVTSTPTILYVDSEGNIIDGPSRGTYPEDIMRGIIEGNIAKVQ